MKNICYEQFLRDFRPLIEALLSCNEDLEEVRASARTSARYHAKGFLTRGGSQGEEARDLKLAEVAEKYGIYNYLPSDEEGTPRFKSDEERENEIDFLTEEHCPVCKVEPSVIPQPQEELFVSSERGTFQTKCKQCGETFRENSAGQALRNLMKHMKFAHGVSL